MALRITAFLILAWLLLLSPVFPQLAERLPERCATYRYTQWLLERDPSLKVRLEQSRDQITHFVTESGSRAGTVINIPVVVHVLWNTPGQNITDAQILSQIDVLNEDFRRLNADTINTPAMFKPVAADCLIEFCMAKRTPDTLPTNGIVRVQTPVTAFPMDNSMKSKFTGGDDPWDPERYLNIWVCNMAGNVLGYAQMPGAGPDSTDGIVIHYFNFGRIGNLNPNYNKGRTASHEAGHWLDLWHIWGDDFGACTGTDYVDDTPNAADANYYCPTHPHVTSCNATGEMFMNYMDYVDDDCFNIFTQGQSDRMHAALAVARPAISSSDGCSPVIGINEPETFVSAMILPNPTNGTFVARLISSHHEPLIVEIFNVVGKCIIREQYSASRQFEIRFNLDVPGGIYFIRITNGLESYQEKIIINR